MTGLDTNVLVRYITQDDAAQSRAAAEAIEQGADLGEDFFINHIVLCELVWVLRRCYNADRATIDRVLEQILRTAHFRIQAIDAVWGALKEYRNSQADFADCLISRENHTAGCAEILTFDRSAALVADFRLLTF